MTEVLCAKAHPVVSAEAAFAVMFKLFRKTIETDMELNVTFRFYYDFFLRVLLWTNLVPERHVTAQMRKL